MIAFPCPSRAARSMRPYLHRPLDSHTKSGSIVDIGRFCGSAVYANTELRNRRTMHSKVSELVSGVGHRAEAAAGDEPRVFRQHAAGVARCGWLPSGAAARQLLVRHVELEQPGLGVDRD